MLTIQTFRQQVQAEKLFSDSDRLLLAVSGGVDSTVLAALCKQAGYDFIIAHCNFQLRGAESDRDEAFVKKLGEQYQVEVLVKRFDTESYAAREKCSIQEAARDLRYNWFATLLDEGKADILLTAHHADDNIETLLMNFFRGTGLAGLTGIPASIGKIRRPLLAFSKEMIQSLAAEYKLDYVEDASNASSYYTRNYFRNEIIPAIRNVYPQVRENLSGNIGRFRDIQKLYRHAIDAMIKKICRIKGEELHIPVRQLLQYDNRALVYEIIAPFGFQEKQVDEVIKLAGSESGKYVQSPGKKYRLIKHRHWFIISPQVPETSSTIVIEAAGHSTAFANGTLAIKNSTTPPARPADDPLIAMLDARNISFPLLLRKTKTGDYFYPLGMKKKKKIARFLVDLKLSKSAKEQIWVIESAQRIVWVVGHRIDDRFKLTPHTKEMLQLQLTPSK